MNTKSATSITYSPVSIIPGSPEAIALTAEDLRVMHYTGRSITHGYGRDKTSTYRSGIQTRIGDIEQGQWQELVRDMIRRTGELELLEQLTEWMLETTPWIHKRKDAEQKALEAFCTRYFDDPGWHGYGDFNRKYQPEVLQHKPNQERKEST